MNYPIEKLGEYMSFSNGRTSPDRTDRGEFPVFGSNGIIGRTVISNAPRRTTVIGRVGTYCGSLHFAKNASWVTDNAIKAVASAEDEARFWYYALISADLGRLRSGSGQPLINQRSLNVVELPVPPRKDRLAIGEILGSLDDKIELNRRMNETLEAMAQAIFRDWFVDFGPTRRKVDGATDPVEIMGGLVSDPDLAKEMADLFPAKLSDNGLPEGWNRKPLFDEAQLISGGTPKTDREEYWGGGITWASAKDVSQCGETYLLTTERTISEVGLQNSSTKLVPQFSTVVVARGATTGRSCMFGEVMAMNQTCYALSSRRNRPFLLNNMFKTIVDSLVQAAHGSVFDTITTKTLATANVVEAEQASVAFEEIATILYRAIENNARQNVTLTATRDLLLPKLMSGEIRLRAAERQLEAVA